jgi:hypothetical protein
MIAKYLWGFGSLIMLILGSIHLFYTFFTNKFKSRNEILMSEMRKSHFLLTRETTMWKAWIGFNASHAGGVLFIGITNFYLAIRHFQLLMTDNFFALLSISTIAYYAWLAKTFWFRIPFVGILITFICYIVSYILTLIT